MLDSIATVSLSGTLREKLEAIADAGFTAAEIFENDFVASDLSAVDLRLLMMDLGLRNVVYQPFRDFEGLSGDARIRAFDRAERKFDLMQAMGTDLLLVCSSTLEAASGDHARIVADFHELGERAATRGLRIAYEALAWGRYVNDHRVVAQIVQQVGLPSVGMVLDSFHSLSRKIPVSSLENIDPQSIFLVQMADAPIMDMDLLQWSRHFRCMPLQGGLPVTEWVAALMQIGYQGPLSLEIFNDRFRAGLSKTIAVDGRRSLIALRDDASRLLGKGGTLPARSPAELTFVEFSAAQDAEGVIAGMLQAIGLRKVGRHRHRAVDLWQGGANTHVVVNRESHSLAGSFGLMHGQGICAIGVRVPNRVDAARRAQALGMSIIEDPADNLSQHAIPAARAVGGSLVYFLDDEALDGLWQREFEMAHPDGVAKGDLHFDHLAAIVRYDEFLSWVLYWSSLFDLHACQEVDLIDPGGVVQSQALENKDGFLRLTLNGALGARTLASRFERHFLGSGYQHLALRTDDIFACAIRMKRAGLPILAIARNYYDDLQARFDLDGAFVARLAASNILYDRDAGGGEFFQIFSRAIDRAFFFEIVQRKNSYNQYGAANTQVRLTAQRRAGQASNIDWCPV
ncbi:4-hydroxyphenylpyruvate dioxygenase [Gluconacetobacter liquefaciens]|uniref:3-dehydroshikimate dehydratase n=1 Tax=Gluconacetobacter liquefaciens TaxID=89584 RepID=A0A370FZT7_GLULI|nr:sugar phosphate isomerase/epimerase and 4-hydroxyphenylpyruvate domain-containing protein [Gluconacetobacter liquefaciens]MBB2187048.1 sugar phosphate isomerase/epimerase and 4-hydroxyphenylpyruvate domain-containing protein [Gluconacetobacter liquefaciens]RDI37022.1 4-hydroxyphenylpyruvate dioxygenase [Gluconacetobacter liquefaciens]GBQ97013.1 4-hydroxyphenylpyruvate dioxygenase [Gluconacetobacter liquefaciens NRIC 0522]GEB39595.1 4-hydroxyphenylpyruvate dioxygenase [Gluconacetobacter lique